MHILVANYFIFFDLFVIIKKRGKIVVKTGKTKIIATVGPSSIKYSTMKEMVEAGMDVVRINFSHATDESRERILKNVKKLRKDLRVPLPIMIDTRGPELRVKKFKNDKVDIVKNQLFYFIAKECLGDENKVSLNMPEVVSSIKVGNKILANDGLIEFKVLEVNNQYIKTKALNSGVLSNNKSLFIPNVQLKVDYLNKQDMYDILWAIKNDVELIAISFVNSAKDVLYVKKFIEKYGGNMKIISKIESAYGVKNLQEIMQVSDGIMVARGDLGVELAMEKLPAVQKRIIEQANEFGLPVITATEMLESMTNSPRPTRAEVSDVANAVYDGTSAVMLSGETASGLYPVQSVAMMEKIIIETEQNLDYAKMFAGVTAQGDNLVNSIAHSAVDASFAEKAKSIIAFTTGGETAQLISRFHPKAEILAATPNEQTYRQMALLWNVKPMISPVYEKIDDMETVANAMLKKYTKSKVKDKAIIVFGKPKEAGGTSLIKIHQIK